MELSKFIYWLGAIAAGITIYSFFAEEDPSLKIQATQSTQGPITSTAISNGPNSHANSNVSVNNTITINDNRVAVGKNGIVIQSK